VVRRSLVGVLAGTLLVFTLATTGLVAIGLVAAAASAPSGGFGAIPYNGTEQSRCQGMSVASHVVFPGADIVAYTTGGICGSAPKDITWSWDVTPGAAVKGCGHDATSCVFKGGASTDGQYTLICINGGNVQGAWQSCDYYGVADPGVGIIDGYVKDKDGGGVAGTELTAYGPQRASAVSGADGYYAMQVHSGSYRVLPSGGPQGKSSPRYSPTVADVSVADRTSSSASFQLQAGVELKLHFDKVSVPADGLQVVNGTITTTEYGKPLPNVVVQLEAMPGEPAVKAVTGSPRASVCSAGSRLWPTGTMNDPDGAPVNITTDAAGHYSLAITVGTTPGTWSLDAWAFNIDGSLSTDTTAASDTQSIDFTRVGTTTASDFVNEFDIAAKSTTALRQITQNSDQIVNTLGQVSSSGLAGTRLGGLAYSLVNGKDGQSVLIFPADKPPVVDSQGALPSTFAANADSLVLDPAEWTGAGLPATVTNAASLQSVLDAGLLPRVPTLTEYDSGAKVAAWKTMAHNEVTQFSQSFEYLGWGYPGIAAAGACY
jgi:hypothetical protein